MSRATLSQAVSIVYRHAASAASFYDDPITIESGMGSEMGPGVEDHEFKRAVAELAAVGWTPREVADGIEQRTTPKWAYEFGLGEWIDREWSEIAAWERHTERTNR